MEDFRSWKIVLIDDEEDIRDVMTVALEDAGYEVETAPDGTAGLRLCEKALPQIVITDIRMPGLDGIQVLEAIKARLPDTEVIVATAFGEMELAIQALQLDASDFITKPINADALHLALDRAKNRFTARKQLADYTSLLEKEHAETSQQLIHSIRFQRNLIESSMDGILACDREGTIFTFNRSMEKISGYPRRSVIRRMEISRFFAPDDELRLRKDLAADTYGGKNSLSLYETTLIGNYGRKIPVQVSATVMSNEGREEGLVFYFRDLRELRRLEREVADQARILHQDKMMALGRLAASVVHEINNPLSGVLNYIRLMLRIVDRAGWDVQRQEKFKRYLELVENETSRCSQIISSLLTFSRKSPPAFGRIDVNELVERCVILIRHKLELGNIRLNVSAAVTVPEVSGDFNQLQQCLINLIFNAADAMADGGTLELAVTSGFGGNEVRIIVKDNGHGISEEDLPYIFEPFYTTKKEGFGVGLGLSTVYGIIEHHNGSISVESRTGAGTVFTISLPAAGQTGELK